MSILGIVDREMTDDAMVGVRVDMVMTVRRITQTALAEQMGVSQSVLSKKIRGSVTWSVSELISAAYHLGTSVAFLVGEIQEAGPTPDPVSSPVSDSNRRPPLYIVDGSGLDDDGPGSWPSEPDKRKTA
jgi:transcriptional regulator with XRE-family HTH domain